MTSCGSGKILNDVLKKEISYNKYTSSITNANLHETALGRSWIQAGKKALLDSG